MAAKATMQQRGGVVQVVVWRSDSGHSERAASALFDFARVVDPSAQGSTRSCIGRRPAALPSARRRSPAGARAEARDETKSGSSRTGARECSAVISTRGLRPAKLLLRS